MAPPIARDSTNQSRPPRIDGITELVPSFLSISINDTELIARRFVREKEKHIVERRKTRPKPLVSAPQVTFLRIVVKGYSTVVPPIARDSTNHDAYMCNMRTCFHAPLQLAATHKDTLRAKTVRVRCLP